MNINDIVGKRFGKLYVIRHIDVVKRHHRYECICDCGKTDVVFRDNLLSGHKISCGECWHIEKENDYYRYFCSNGQSFIFDSVDYDIVKSHRWFISSDGYPKTNIHHNTAILSRLILNAPQKYYADHIDRNPFLICVWLFQKKTVVMRMCERITSVALKV